MGCKKISKIYNERAYCTISARLYVPYDSRALAGMELVVSDNALGTPM